jgi:hypothetical protein
MCRIRLDEFTTRHGQKPIDLPTVRVFGRLLRSALRSAHPFVADFERFRQGDLLRVTFLPNGITGQR